MLSFAGLRGPTGIALSLYIYVYEDNIKQFTKDLIIFYMSGVACLTVWINGVFSRCLIKVLRLKYD